MGAIPELSADLRIGSRAMERDDTEVTTSANIGDEPAAVASDAESEDTALAPQMPEGETRFLAGEKATELADALAWSDEEAGPTEPRPFFGRRAHWRWVAAVLALTTSLVAITAIGLVYFRSGHRTRADAAAATTTPAIAAPSPGPHLDGTYRFDFDYGQATYRGGVIPHDDGIQYSWWAFTSACTALGCTANGAKLDNETHLKPAGPSDTGAPTTTVLNFVNGAWRQAAPAVAHRTCSGGAGNDATVDLAWELEPSPDGTLHGLETHTLIEGSACGLNDKLVFQVPFTATRVGAVPPGVSQQLR
jgi:serine/threonine protein kinase, bacterial